MPVAGGSLVTVKVFRDVVTFLGGLTLLGFEVLTMPDPRLEILGIAAAMMGLPGTLGLDRILNRGESPADTGTPDTPAEKLTTSDSTPTPPRGSRHAR